MKKRRVLAILSVVICTAMLLSGCSVVEKLLGGNKAEERRTIPYSDMEYTRPDVEAIQTRLGELTVLLGDAKNFDEVLKYDDETGQLLEEFSTMSTLAMLKNYHDSNDTFYKEEYTYCEEQGVVLWNSLNEFNTVLVEGEYADQYRQEVGEYTYQSILNDLKLNTPAVEQLKQERERLNIEYNNSLSNLVLEWEGTTYTLEDIYAMNSYEDMLFYMNLYYEENAPQFTEYYIQLINLDKEIAQTLGFESVADMYYLSYNRDYTPADAQVYWEESKELFVPVAEVLGMLYVETGPITMETTFENMPRALSEISPELKEAWEYMQENELCDYEPLPNKQSGIAFTTSLPMYDAPFIYGYWEDGINSATTVMHEFGHFYDRWLHYDVSTPQNLDIAEVYSQGLELLMQPEFRRFTRESDMAVASHLKDFINPLTFQIMLEEFQQRVYELEDLNVENISRLYSDLLEEYGLNSYSASAPGEIDYSWFRITHLFDAPFYTVSYWTSAVVALQIWTTSLEDWDAGVEIYLTMLHEDQNQPFGSLLSGAGLQQPGNRQVLEEIADQYETYFDLDQYRGQFAEAA